MSMKKKKIPDLKLKSSRRDMRLRQYVHVATNLEQIGNVRESRGVRKMAACKCIVVLYPAWST